ncbi:MAG TPA: hypothetical protein VHV53_08255 [Solirubrobacterales bacterium]|jgi:ribose transport system substrate-binding protein|nr:hypothetical protein [Solirubrobacterales bacterium]
MKKHPYAWVLVGLVLAAAVISGCGSGSSSSSSASGSESSASSEGEEASGSSLEGLKEEVAALKERPTEIGLTESITKPLPKGGKIDMLVCGVPACGYFVPYLKEAATAAGWTVKPINEGLTPETVKAAWEQVVRDEPDAVVITGGYPTEIFQTQLNEVAAKNIPVVDFANASTKPGTGEVAIIFGGTRFANIGKLWARIVTAESEGKANVLNVYTSTFPSTTVAAEAFDAEIKKICSGCSVEDFNIPATDVGKEVPQQIASKVQANPNTDWVVIPITDFERGVPEALRGVGREPGLGEGQVKLLGQDDSITEMEDIENEEMFGTINLPQSEAMWRAMDIVLRSKLGLPTQGSTSLESYKEWLLTKENLPPGIVETVSGSVPGSVEYVAQYKKLWGIE